MSSTKYSASAYALGDHGPFADRASDFRARPAQLQMAEVVEQALAERETVVIEAGTGTGKTFAYLVPALLAGERVIISTGTKNLQDQLFHRDLPTVSQALNVKPRAALLKGRNNYLCLYRLEQARTSGRLPTRESVRSLRLVEQWSRGTHSGDLSECVGLSDDDPITGFVTSTSENCLGGDCPYYGDCHVIKARRTAMEAEIVVVNHHLLLADLALKEEGFGELLPGAAAVIVDEAHQLAETASTFFGQAISSRQLLEFVRDIETEAKAHADDQTELFDALRGISKAVADIRLLLGKDRQRAPLQFFLNRRDWQQQIELLESDLLTCREQLEIAADRSEGLANGLARVEALMAKLASITTANDPDNVRWFETYKQGFALNSTPLLVAESFQRQASRYKNAAWIFTSATLSVNKAFKHFTEQLGLEEAKTVLLDSPFDYPRQSMLFVPQGLPEPDAPHYLESLLEVTLPLLQASEGRAFLLFTSYRALQWMAQELPQRIPYPVLVQGSQPRNRLLDTFRKMGNAVLLGTSSFWEGVDVRGDALSLVIIDKLPFSAPDDPVLRARMDACRRNGGEPFNDMQLPRAVITLKQGAGRLIRDITDTGVLTIADPRLFTRPYGKVFLNSLPPMPVTRQLSDVRRFFLRHEK
ncbi:ATP-dependent DNA helicase [Permianibacter aggregans]|uniref:DNA 5'-3' helicase n=1 Tax=Permianibacter aggregans TaxID=1510150 RepID=A0A4R6UKD4_9GAMM|nr:ATP-dependent DNA helicase [Permianibacter aggregans]TDQ45565.1 ATP-dependent DNA helicase DinG [Permianibacter aggregans]